MRKYFGEKDKKETFEHEIGRCVPLQEQLIPFDASEMNALKNIQGDNFQLIGFVD